MIESFAFCHFRWTLGKKVKKSVCQTADSFITLRVKRAVKSRVWIWAKNKVSRLGAWESFNENDWRLHEFYTMYHAFLDRQRSLLLQSSMALMMMLNICGKFNGVQKIHFEFLNWTRSISKINIKLDGRLMVWINSSLASNDLWSSLMLYASIPLQFTSDRTLTRGVSWRREKKNLNNRLGK